MVESERLESLGELLVFAMLDNECEQGKQWIRGSVKKIAGRTKLSEPMVWKIIKNLAEKKLVSQESGERGEPNAYTTHPENLTIDWDKVFDESETGKVMNKLKEKGVVSW